MKTRDDFFNRVKDLVAKKLDWNLRDAEVISYRITTDWRMQVVLVDRCPRGASDTRGYLKKLVKRAHKHRIDLTVVHVRP